MNVCSMYIEEAHRCAREMHDIDAYSFIFLETEGDPTTKKMMKENNESMEKSKGLIRRAIEAIKNVYRKIRDILSDLKDRILLKPNEREEYAKFCKEMKSNPEFKNKKITVRNWRLINSTYENVVSEIQGEIEKAKRSEEELKPSIKKAITEKILQFGETAKNATIQITADQLLVKCKQDQDFAKKMEDIINHDFGMLDSIMSGLDQSTQDNFKKEVHKAANVSWLRQKLADIRFKMSSAESIAKREERQHISALMKSFNKIRKDSNISELQGEAIDIGITAAKEAIGMSKADAKQARLNKKQLKNIERGEKRAQKKIKREEKIKSKRAEVRKYKSQQAKSFFDK